MRVRVYEKINGEWKQKYIGLVLAEKGNLVKILPEGKLFTEMWVNKKGENQKVRHLSK